MNKIMTKLISVLVLSLALTGCKMNEFEPQSNQFGREWEAKNLANLLLQGAYENIYAQFHDEFKQSVSFDEFKRLAKGFNKGVRKYDLLSESLSPNIDGSDYIWIDTSGTKGISAQVDKNLVIHGLLLRELTTYPETDAVYTQNEYIMPITDTWYVGWGGANELVNYHYAYENERYAYDLIKLNDGKSYNGDPLKNESYYAFGSEVIAPADGIVVKLENNIPDNIPVGAMFAKKPFGNYVMIDHGHQEFSVIAHLKQGTINVNVGDKVKRGQTIGLAGNSGNSSEPHIHFQVQNSSDLNAKSIRIRFVSGANPDPIKGQYVKPANQ